MDWRGVFQSLTVDDLLFAIVSLLVSFVILIFQAGRIADRRTPFESERPSTYFPLDTYMSRRYANVLCYSIAAPLAILILVVCWRAKQEVIGAATVTVPNYIGKIIPDQYSELREYLSNAALKLEFLSPLLIFLFTLILFAPYVEKFLKSFEDLFFASNRYRTQSR